MKRVSVYQSIFVFVCCVAFGVDGVAADFVSDGLYYNILSEADKTVEITYEKSKVLTNYSSLSGELVIPRTVENNGVTYSVTAIGDNAFFSCKGVTSVTIPSNIVKVGGYTFQNCM